MRSTRAWMACALTIGFVASAGCGGGAEGGNEPAAGAKNAGAGGGSAGSSNMVGGSANSGAGQSNSAGVSSTVACSSDDCGPQLGLPNWTCDDGSTGGPTGRCVARGDACGWEVHDCPPGGEGGASGQGGYGNGSGAPGAGGAGSDPCGGCDVPDEVCVYQAGGPGPSRFRCATQLPCGAPGACACIVDEGACQMMLMGDPPNYCACDNGLD